MSPVRSRVTLCVLFCTPLCGLSITFCGSETFVQRRRKLQPLDSEHVGHSFAQTPGCGFMFLLEEACELFEPFDAFFGVGNTPGRSHQIQRLWLLFFRSSIQYVPVWPKYRNGFYSKCLRVRRELRKGIKTDVTPRYEASVLVLNVRS